MIGTHIRWLHPVQELLFTHLPSCVLHGDRGGLMPGTVGRLNNTTDATTSMSPRHGPCAYPDPSNFILPTVSSHHSHPWNIRNKSPKNLSAAWNIFHGTFANVSSRPPSTPFARLLMPRHLPNPALTLPLYHGTPFLHQSSTRHPQRVTPPHPRLPIRQRLTSRGQWPVFTHDTRDTTSPQFCTPPRYQLVFLRPHLQ